MEAIDWLAKRASYHPEKTALVEAATGRRFSYGELDAQSERAAAYLESVGLRAGDRLAVLSGNSAEVLFAFFGVGRLGAIFVPLNTRLAPPELAAIVERARPSMVFYSGEYAALAEALRPAFAGARTLTRMDSVETPRRRRPPVDEDAPQMLLFTSGTTGRPKGAVLPHRMLLWNAINFAARDLLPSDTVLAHSPMFYTAGLNVYALPALFAGGTVVLARGWNTDEMFDLIERERVTVFFGVPTQLLMFTNSPRFETADLGSLRYVISGGAPCPAALIERLVERGLAYRQGMGLTEVGPSCFSLEPRDALRKPGSIGFPNIAMEARIVDGEGHDLGAGEVGELALRSPAMCSGYWEDPEATAAAIRGGWFFTGDLARRDTEGYYYIVDRKKDMFISGGENVYPAEVEHVLAGHPAVYEVSVVGVPDAKWGEVGCAAVVLRPGAQCAETDLLRFCEGRLARFKIPKSVRFFAELPRTHSGKVQKSALRKWIAG